MASKHTEPSEILSWIWLKDEFERLHREHREILNNTPRLCSPELEAQVLLAQKLSSAIDRKVPDRNVPPKP